jgi:CRISPR type I-E-associated protein CasB/Cse2
MTELHQWSGNDIAETWWRELTSHEVGGRVTRGTRRAALAGLRRAGTPLEVIQEPEALRLITRLPHENPDRVAMLAGILAFVRESDDRPVARAIGRTSLDDESAVMSESRFRRLMQVSGEELMGAMRRLVRLTKGRANVNDLSFAVLRWGDGVKKRWIFSYYGVHGVEPSR